MRYCSHIWAGAPRCYLGMLDKPQNGRRWIVGPSLGPSLEPVAHRRHVGSLNLFHWYYFGRCSSELPQLVGLHYSRVRSIRFSNRLRRSYMLQGCLCSIQRMVSFDLW